MNIKFRFVLLLIVSNGGLQDFISDRENSSSAYQFVMPSLAVNSSGDVVIGFSCARDTEYIGASFWGRKSNGTISGRPVLIQAGRDLFLQSRWGDYSSTTVDESTGHFWTIQEYEPLFDAEGCMVYGLMALLLNNRRSP